MKQSKEVKILIAVIITLVVALLLWNNYSPARGKYKAPYKYYKGDNADYYRKFQK